MFNFYSGNVIDIEASSLRPESYPIEIAVRFANGDAYDSLIKPSEDWKDWSQSSEQAHGIKRDELFKSGKDIREICTILNDLCEGETFFSDAWAWDSMWLKRLFDRSGLRMTFCCSPMEYFMPEHHLKEWANIKQEISELKGLKAHRALNDVHIIGGAFDHLADMGDIKMTSELEKYQAGSRAQVA